MNSSYADIPGRYNLWFVHRNTSISNFMYDMRSGTNPRTAWNDNVRQTNFGYSGGVWNNFSVYFNWTQAGKLQYNLYHNGSFIANFSDSVNNVPMWSYFFLARESTQSYWIDNFTACNSTSPTLGCSVACGSVPAPPDTTPPAFSNCNVTSEGGAGQNCSTKYPKTNDTTPTVRVATNENANCDILDNISNTITDCSVTVNTEHTCTQLTSMPITLSNLTINCSDSS